MSATDPDAGTWIVLRDWTTADGDTSTTAVGPFPTEADAVEWMNSEPDDPELTEGGVWYMDPPTTFRFLETTSNKEST